MAVIWLMKASTAWFRMVLPSCSDSPSFWYMDAAHSSTFCLVQVEGLGDVVVGIPFRHDLEDVALGGIELGQD